MADLPTIPHARETYDAVVIGSGPNGLGAAVALARAGASVLVVEARDTAGGGMRTAELTLPGFRHDVCSACHPTGILSPWFRQLPLAEHGLRWRQSGVSMAHPMDDGPAILVERSVHTVMEQLGVDGDAYRALVEPFLADPDALFADLLGPLRVPTRPLTLTRFGLQARRSARGLAEAWFRTQRARALVAGCAGHTVLPLETPFTAAATLVFLISAHVADWPVAEGGSQAIADALVSVLEAYGGELVLSSPVRDLSQLPPSKVVLFDTSPDQLAALGADHLPERYRRALGRYRYGPGSFKVDWALDGPIPWSDARVNRAATVHLGGTFDEIAAAEGGAWRGEHHDRPYVLLVQQSELDATRAPEGQHTGYAYCHVPHGSTVDRREAIEAQVERFAPGFRDRILATHTTSPADFHAYNANYVGGAVTGGAADIWQLFTRPVARLDPYTTPNPHLFLCSASTPPGGGVHGMGGFFAARSALRRLSRLTPRTW